MEERRRSARTDLQAELILKRLDQQTGEKVSIHIKDVSKAGIGFLCDAKLEMGAVYECYLTIWTKEVIHSIIEIIRMEEHGDGYAYGSLFVGMADLDAQRIMVYQTVEEYKK